MAQGLHFISTIDDTDFKKKLENQRRMILDSGKTAESEAQKIENMYKRAGLAVAGYFTAQQALSFGQDIIKVRGERQLLEQSFEVLLQSRAKANNMIGEITQLAINSPLEMTPVANAAQTLLGFGVSADKVMPVLRQLSDVSMGNQQRFEGLSLVYAQVQSAGKLMGQDLLQMISAGFNPLTIIAEQTGKSVAQLKEEMAKGAISAEMVANAFTKVTSEGGKFYEMTQKQADGIIGNQATFEDAIVQMKNKIGANYEDIIKGGYKAATVVVENYDSIGKAIMVLISAYGSYKAALIAVSVTEKLVVASGNITAWLNLAKGIRTTKDAMVALNLAMGANPILKIVSLLIAAGTALYLFSKNTSDAEKELSGLEKATKSAGEEFDKEAAKIKALQDVMNNSKVAYNDRKRALNELKTLIPQYNGELDKEGRILNSNTDAIKDYLVQLEKQIKMKAAQDELEEAYKNKRQLEKNYGSKYDVWSSMNTNSAYHEEPIIDVVGMFGGRDLQKAEKAKDEAKQKLNDIEATISSLNSEIEKTADDTGEAINEVKSFSDQMQEAAFVVTTLKTKLTELKAGKGDSGDFARDIEDTTKQLKDAESKYALLTGIDEKVSLETRKAQEITSNQLKLEDEKTAILEDGRKKRLALSEQELVEKKAVLKKEYDETVAEYKKLGKALPKEMTTIYNQRIEVADTAKTSRDIEINKETDKELQEHQKSITDVFLNEESKRLEAIKERYNKEREWADAQFKGGNMTVEQRDNYKSDVDKSQHHEELESLLKEYQIYADKRKEIEDKFNSEIATMRSKNEGGKYDAQIKQAEKQKNKSISDLGVENLLDSNDAKTLFGNLDNISSKTIQTIAASLKAKAAEQFKDGILGDEAYIDMLKRIGEAEQKAQSSNPFSTLAKSAKTAFSKIDEGDEKSTEKHKQSWKEMGVSMGQSLDIAAQAMGEIGNIADALGASEETQATISQVTGMLSGAGDIAKGLATGDISSVIKGVGGMITSMIDLFDFRSKRANKIIKEEQENIKELGKKYKDLERTIADTLGSDYYKKQIEQTKNLQEQQRSIDKMIDAENSKRKRKRDSGKIDEWNEQKKDLVQQAKEIRQTVIDELSTTDIKSYSSDLSSSLIDGLSQGLDNANEVLDEKMDALLKNMIAKQFDMLVAQERMKPMFNAMADGFGEDSDGGLALTDSELKKIIEKGNEGKAGIISALDDYEKVLKEFSLINENITDKASSSAGSIKEELTEQTGSELLGMFRLQSDTMLQIKGISTNQFEFIKTGWSQIADIARTNLEIAANTFRTANNTDGLIDGIKGLDSRLKKIETNTQKSYTK